MASQAGMRKLEWLMVAGRSAFGNAWSMASPRKRTMASSHLRSLLMKAAMYAPSYDPVGYFSH